MNQQGKILIILLQARFIPIWDWGLRLDWSELRGQLRSQRDISVDF